jgi:hypothetical protein
MWLDDEIVAATQHLLSLQYPAVGGLQPPVVVTSLSIEPQTHEFVQVVNVSNNHWIVPSTIGCQPISIKIYDSLNGYLPSSITMVVCNLLMTTDKIITVTYVNVQYQIGASDCGLFALAFATSLCSGQDPATLRYEQKSLRQHLLQCITRQKMSTFPHATKRAVKKVTAARTEKIPVFCVCRLPDDGSQMIKCNSCNEWFHQSCIHIDDKFFSYRHLSWNCLTCTK